MEFNSQVCTTKEQSEKLLALGLKKETADCMYSVMTKEYNGRYILEEDRQYHLCLFYQEEVQSVGFEAYVHIPAWSLHRLMEMLADTPLQVGSQVGMYVEDTYDMVIQGIEWLISRGQFNKDYLEDKP